MLVVKTMPVALLVNNKDINYLIVLKAFFGCKPVQCIR
jgi:hypothetical protein